MRRRRRARGSRRERGAPEQLPLVALVPKARRVADPQMVPKTPPRRNVDPEAAAKVPIRRRAKPPAVPGHVRLVLTLDLPREHCPGGEFAADVGEQTDDGYRLRVACPCGAVAAYWVTREIAAKDLIGSRLLTSEN